MTKPSQSGFKRFFYNQNIKRDKSGKKYKNLINHYILLIKRVEKNGMDARLVDALSKAKKKIIAYGIALYQVEAVLKQRGLDRLIELFHTTFVGEAREKKIIVKKTMVVESKKVSVKKVAKEIGKGVNDTVEEKAIKKDSVKKTTKTATKTEDKKSTTKKTDAKKTIEKKAITKEKTTK